MRPQTARENSITIQWHSGLLDRLRELVFGGPNSPEQPRECGGLLLGSVQRKEIIVRLFAPISCSYQERQLYHLSAADKASLQHSIEGYASPHWSFIGFYRSHCRPGLEPDEEDLQLAREHLKSPPGIFLLVAENGAQGLFLFDGVKFSRGQPFALSNSPPSRHGGFAPDLPRYPSYPSGGIQQRYGGIPRRFVSGHVDRVAKGLAALARQLHAAADSVRERVAVQLSWFVAVLAGTRVPGWLACTLIVLVVGLFAVWNPREHAPGPRGKINNYAPFNNSLGLVTSVELYHVLVAWNPQAPSIAGASSGILLVKDGEAHYTFPLDERALAQGSMVYYPISDAATFELRIGGMMGLSVAAGLDRVLKTTPPLPTQAREQERVPQFPDALKSTGTITGTTSNHALPNATYPSDKGTLSALARDTAPARIRSRYEPPPSFRSVPSAPELLQPPDLDVAGNPTLRVAAGLPLSIPPPPAPLPSGSESAVPGPSEHVNFVAAQTIKHVSPQSSANALRLLVASVTIRVHVQIDSQGRVVRADSLSHGGTLIEYLSNLSVNAARGWLFAPARREARNVDSDTVLEFVFDNNGIQLSP
jgi:hypothetical protein